MSSASKTTQAEPEATVAGTSGAAMPPLARVRDQLAAFLDEDLANGDVTSESVIDADRQVRAIVEARQAGVVAGVAEGLLLCELAGVHGEARAADGDRVGPGAEVLRLSGSARTVLGVERTLLNVMSHMSGVATATRHAVDMIATTFRPDIAGRDRAPRIAATRKTLPGLRALQKKAVVIAGGEPHRSDLGEAVLIKDNHLALSGGIVAAVARARAGAVGKRIEIEVETLDEALEAAGAGADILLLDNMPPDEVRAVAERLAGDGLRESVVLEASGGISADNVAAYANSGVDMISMGALTASAASFDLSLEVTSEEVTSDIENGL